ncbi:unnamed protein product, partial [Mesorhabditis belari]|uniref:Dynamin-binding protein n=1 Tax=Mesorhabditis belari TaxID=2138241 RepID=A0AAF3FBP4_9BILA
MAQIPAYARVTNGFVDPQSGLALAQDQIVRIIGSDHDQEWYKIQTLTGTNGRSPKALTNKLPLTLRSVSERLVVSIAAFEGQEKDDLSFDVNQLITVERDIDDNWSSGAITSDAGKRLGKSGLFPTSYVQELPGVPVGGEPVDNSDSIQSPRVAPSLPTMSARSTHTINEAIGPYARSAFPFQGEYSNELSFGANEIIKLLRRVDQDWLEGEINGRTGIFPSGYAQIVVDLDTDKNGSSDARKSVAQSTQDEGIGVATVKHAFNGRETDELTLQAGDSVRIIRMIDNEWVLCREPLSDRVGIVPSNFLEMYLDDDVEELAESVHENLRDNDSGWGSSTINQSNNIYQNTFNTQFNTLPGPQSSALPSNSSWAKFEEWDIAKSIEDKKPPPARPPPPKALPTSPDSGSIPWASFSETTPKTGVTPSTSTTVLSSNSATTNIAERNRVINELIASEQAYCTDMQSLEKAVAHSNKLSDKNKRVLTSGIPQIVEVSLLLADTLKIDLDEPIDRQKIGEIFMNMQKMFSQAYGYFFRNIEAIHSIVENKNDKKLQAAMGEILTSMRTYGSMCFDVPTAISRPVHRALKYPLFLSEIIKHTSVTHPDHPKLLEAFKQMSTLGQKMNESKRRKELTRKYSEEQSATLTQKLSRLSVHSVVKKSNRFKYRMGSAIGILHLTKDTEFEQMVYELDQCERRLVRFNYQLVIYQKKLQHDMKRQIEVLIVAPNASRMPEKAAMQQLKPFFEILQEFVKETNYKVKDDCLKAIRVIPKRLITKRNDKLMDYEAAKSSAKMPEEINARFRDFDALNQQVKTTVPKVVDVMNQVLRNGMITLEELDSTLMRNLKDRFEIEQGRSTHLLITPSTICFVDLMDKNRLTPLRQIASKATSNLRPLKSSMKKKGIAERKDDTTSSTVSQKSSITPDATPAALDAIWKAAAAPPPVTPSAERKFRAQTETEKRTLLEKADAKSRRADVYKCVSEWPASLEAREASEKTGRMLIVKAGDAVLAVRKEERGLWYCYNGYYNGLLPSGILTPYYERPGTNIGEPFADLGLLEQRVTVATERPKSTPPVKQSNNLIDLLDDLVPPTTTSIAPLQPVSLIPSLSPRPIYPALNEPVLAEPPAIDWRMSSRTAFDAFNDSLRTSTAMSPLTPIQTNQMSLSMTPLQPSPAPSTTSLSSNQPSNWMAFGSMPASGGGLPPLPPQQNGSTRNTSNRASASDETFSQLWDQFKATPLNKVRSESPQPLVPTRPQVGVATYAQPPAYDQPPGWVSFYDEPPAESLSFGTNPFASSSTVAYDTPPATEFQQISARSAPAPPQSLGLNKAHTLVVAEYDFTPVGDNQLLIREGERLQLVQRHDDDGNSEWVLVRRPNGEHGYVPSTYIKDL